MSQLPPSPYSKPTTTQAEQPDNALKILLIILAVIGVLGLLMCGGIVGLGYYAMQQVRNELANLDTDYDDGYAGALKAQIAQDPTVSEELGEIEEISEDWTRISEEEAWDESYWYLVEGTKSDARIETVLSDHYGAEGHWFESATLVLDDGRRVELQLQPAPFDSEYGKWLYDRVKSNPKLKSLIGELQFIAHDDVRTEREEADTWNYWFTVRGSDGEVSVVAEESEYEDIFVSAEVELEDGSRETLFGPGVESSP